MVFWDEYLVKSFALLTLVAQLIILAYLVDLLIGKLSGKRFGDKAWKYFNQKSLLFMFVLSFTAMVGSLMFSELLGFAPCLLCWYQRIFMYPIVFLSGLALIRRDKRMIMPYIVLLAFIGLLIAGFHYYGQVSSSGLTLPCSTLGYSESCSEYFFKEFGFITIPMMAFTAFLGIVLLYFNYRKS